MCAFWILVKCLCTNNLYIKESAFCSLCFLKMYVVNKAKGETSCPVYYSADTSYVIGTVSM